MKLVWVTQAKYLHDYVVALTFNDETRCELDFTKVLDMRRKLFSPLLDKDIFRQFSLDGWTLTWKDGTIDIAPERLYEAAKCPTPTAMMTEG